MRLRLRIQPRSSKNAVEGPHGDSLRVRLTAPPVEGEANKALIKFLSTLLGVKRSEISLEAGHKSRDKTVVISGVTVRQLRDILPGSTS